MRQLKTVVVGVGRIGWQFHLPGIVRHGGFELAAAADPLAERRAETEKEFGIRTYDDPVRMYDAERPDLAVIASPSHLHAAHAIAAMERGIDVFCDKPLAVTLAEGDGIIDAMRRTGRKLMVYQPMRLERPVLAMRGIIESGTLGDIFMLKAALSGYSRRNDWQALRRFGGGSLNNAGSHIVDCMLHLAQSRAAAISCHMARVASLGDAEDVVKLLAKTGNGVVLDIDINYAAAFDLPRWAVYGSRGTAVFVPEDDSEGRFDLKYFQDDELPEKRFSEGTAAPDRLYMRDSIPWRTASVRLDDITPPDYYEYCYQYFALNSEPFVPIEQTRELLRVISEARAADGNFPL